MKKSPIENILDKLHDIEIRAYLLINKGHEGIYSEPLVKRDMADCIKRDCASIKNILAMIKELESDETTNRA